MRKLLKEPLLHFLLLGACLFALFHWAGSRDDQRERDEIVVTPGRIESLGRIFEKTWQRPPTERELDGLIREHVREEIMYREALALGLDRDDTIVRRRLRQKIEFLSEDIMALPEPSDEELAAYLQEHPESFRLEARLTFQHVYLNADRRGGALYADAQSLLDELREQEGDAAVSDLGDAFLLGRQFEEASEREIGRTFGQDFVAPLMKAPTQEWHGPVASGYGIHLVYVSERIDSRAPALEEVRDVVEREWSAAKRKEANEAFYEALRERYTVTIEKPRLASPKVALVGEGTE
jgi:hypothetical protein